MESSFNGGYEESQKLEYNGSLAHHITKMHSHTYAEHNPNTFHAQAAAETPQPYPKNQAKKSKLILILQAFPKRLKDSNTLLALPGTNFN